MRRMAGKCSLVPALLLWSLHVASCFNLETSSAQIKSYPYTNTQGREAYFGFSVALQHHRSGSSWLVIGAPRANSSYYDERRFQEPGAVFKCPLNSGEPCQELFIDQTANNQATGHQDLKNWGWLGGSLDTQPTYTDRQATSVCAPLWKNQNRYPDIYMNGACYWMTEALPNTTAHKLLPLTDEREQLISWYGNNFYYYAFGQAGFSLHFPEDQSAMIIGAPGVFNWKGTVILIQDYKPPEGIVSKRRRRQAQVLENDMFSVFLVPNPIYTYDIKDFDLMGYSVTSGHFLAHDQLLYAAGAPRGQNAYGMVIMFEFPQIKNRELSVKYRWSGQQLGEYFGAALTTADLNNDGLGDLVVGCPMFSLPDYPDLGRIQVILSSKEREPQLSNVFYHGNRVAFARFGTTLASAGDLNADQHQDIAVGSPWEEDGNGAVYIFLGSPNGLQQQYSQRLSPEDFLPGLRGFGMSISRGIDTDNNGYPDLAIGSFLSGHAVVVRSRPVAVLSGELSVVPPTIAWEGEIAVTLIACLTYEGFQVPGSANIRGNLTLDYLSPSPRAIFPGSKNFKTFSSRIFANKATCTNFSVTVMEEKIDPFQPLVMKMEYELLESPHSPPAMQAMTDPRKEHSKVTRVSIVTGCKEEICKVDVMIKATVNSQDRHEGRLVIGQDSRPVLQVEVFNNGEPVFLPNMTVRVDPPLALFMPATHNCKFLDPDMRTLLECSLSNPITKERKDTVNVTVDASQLTDHSSSPGVNVTVTGEGEEILPIDNQDFQRLKLTAQASLQLLGYSKEEQVLYERIAEDQINVTTTPTFIHSFTLVKKGPTPIGQVKLTIKIPVNFTDGQKFVEVHPPQTNFLGQPVSCMLSGSTYVAETSEDGNLGASMPGDRGNTITSLVPSKSGNMKTNKDRYKETQHFNCSSDLIRCAFLTCNINSWPMDTRSAEISFKLSINLTAMAGHISAKAGAVLKSTAVASIQSVNSELLFIGEKSASADVATQIQPNSLPGEGVPWWVILLAVLGGLLLLGLLAYGLYKAGFFQRKEMDEMRAHQAQVVESSQGGYGTTNPGHVGD